MAGRRPLPTAVRIAQGESPTRGRGHSSPITADDFQPEAGMPEMPKHLGKVGRREWHIMTRALLEHGVITKVDRQALATYCEAVDAKEEAQRKCRETGGRVIATYMERDGERLFLKMETNPWWKIWKESVTVEKAYLIEFGLTPASRSRLKLPKKEKKSELEKLRERGTVGFTPPPAPEPPMPGTDGPVNKA